jgi:hypothetical protein
MYITVFPEQREQDERFDTQSIFATNHRSAGQLRRVTERRTDENRKQNRRQSEVIPYSAPASVIYPVQAKKRHPNEAG